MTDITCLFCETQKTLPQLALDIDELFKRNYSASLKKSYSKVEHSEEFHDYSTYDDKLDLAGLDDLTARLGENRGGEYGYELELSFATTDIYLMMIDQAFESSRRTVAATFDKLLTDYLLKSEEPRAPFAMLLVELAEVIGSSCFIAGMNFDAWEKLSIEDMSNRASYGASPIIAGWNLDKVDSQDVTSTLNIASDMIMDMHDSFQIAMLFKG